MVFVKELYDYLDHQHPLSSTPEVQRHLLFILSAMGELCVKHPADELTSLYHLAIQAYAKSNGWIPYRKRELASELNLTLSQTSRYIRQLQSDNQIKIHTLPVDTFIEILPKKA